MYTRSHAVGVNFLTTVRGDFIVYEINSTLIYAFFYLKMNRIFFDPACTVLKFRYSRRSFCRSIRFHRVYDTSNRRSPPVIALVMRRHIGTGFKNVPNSMCSRGCGRTSSSFRYFRNNVRPSCHGPHLSRPDKITDIALTIYPE